jgi:hypothetical protein
MILWLSSLAHTQMWPLSFTLSTPKRFEGGITDTQTLPKAG